MDTALIVAIAIWNAILLAGLVAVIRWRRRLLAWATSADGWRDIWSESGADANGEWAVFLAEHPELRPLQAAESERRL
jgi:hypothetical protein